MEKTQKKQIKRYIAYALVMILVLMLAAVPLVARDEAVQDDPQASILTATVEKRDVEHSIIGGGTLASSDTVELTVPAEVKLKEYLVGNGDVVSEGDIIALVDKVSVLSAISQVQETLDYLSGRIQATAGDQVSKYVSANAKGTVKQIFADTGDDVADVMLRHGALAILSLDGKMAVTISRRTDLPAGAKVCVTLSGGKEVEGTVASNRNGQLVVTVTDDGYAQGDPVTVTTQAGDRIGAGELYINSPWLAHGYSGTVSRVNVQVGQQVSAGQTLITLHNTGSTSEYKQLVSQRGEYEQMMESLFKMYGTGTITAPCDGIVSGVDTDGTFMLEEGGQFRSMLAVTILGSGSNAASDADPQVEQGAGSNLPDLSGGLMDRPSIGDVQIDPPPGVIEPTEGEDVLLDLCTRSEDCPALMHDSGCPKSGVTETVYAGWIAVVQSVGPEGAVIKKNPNAIRVSSFSGLTVDPASLTEESTLSATTYADGSPICAGDTLLIQFGTGELLKVSGGGGQMPGGMGGGMNAGGMPSGGMGGGQAATFTLYSLDTVTVATVTSQETMTLDFVVDEADILQLYIGQEADLTVTPLGGQHFTAVITRISNNGSNDGGRTKFTVTASVEKHSDMYPGMSATVELDMVEATQTPVLPVEALVEDGVRTLVYTGYDEKEKTLTGPMEITTGISDGLYVQVPELEPGTKVYYAYYDTLVQSVTPEPGGMFR